MNDANCLCKCYLFVEDTFTNFHLLLLDTIGRKFMIIFFIFYVQIYNLMLGPSVEFASNCFIKGIRTVLFTFLVFFQQIPQVLRWTMIWILAFSFLSTLYALIILFFADLRFDNFATIFIHRHLIIPLLDFSFRQWRRSRTKIFLFQFCLKNMSFMLNLLKDRVKFL